MANTDTPRRSVPSTDILSGLGSIVGRGYVSFMYLVLVLPMVIILGVSLTAGEYFSFPPEGLSLQYYTQILGSAKWLDALQLSLTVATGASLVATSIGACLAFALNRYDITYGKFVWGLGVVPLLVPPVIVAVALMSFFLLVGIWGTVWAIILAHGVVFSPFSFVLISSGLDEIDSAVEEVSRNLGATKFQTLRRITFPLIASNVFVAVLFTFILSLNEYLIALLVGGPALDTIPVVIFASLRYNYTPAIASVSVLYMALTIGFVLVINYRLDGQLW
ncbi:ABC transporter permease [Haloarcula sp. S1CR25-12]|uniref:ABC transporter permease n=1 Tax=Haloarcula saliterrae TaxID=2950534 RepID=A0ABU2FFN0_9EURY|nr:ABC transporter permease [Haloarcula sp. S1CR25-12]MDS0261077.1 ABC transporter permease [Haloarcula sp. S1CR25-12]